VAITWPLSPALRYLINIAAAGSFALYEHLHNGEDQEPDLEWRRVQIRFSRTNEDDITTSLDLLNITSAEVDTSWITSDYTDAETALNTFLTSWKPNMSGTTTAVEYRWYRMAFTDPGSPRPFVPSILPERLTTISIAGTGTTYELPPQCASVITEKTFLPRHWGRMFMPCDGQQSILGSNGQIATAAVDLQAAAAATLFSALWDADLVPVVPITQLNGDSVRALTNVTHIRVDSVMDIIRSRRPRTITREVETAVT